MASSSTSILKTQDHQPSSAWFLSTKTVSSREVSNLFQRLILKSYKLPKTV